VKRPIFGIGPTVSEEVLSAFLPARRTWERYGVTSMTLHRWLRDDRLDFPKPMLIGRMRFWRIADLEVWEASRAQPRAALIAE
jgi:predicted DNA-binding transcriptional regulator AlpA